MAILSVAEDIRPRTYRQSRNQTTAKRVFTVRATTATAPAIVAQSFDPTTGLRIPVYGQSYGTAVAIDRFLIVSDVEVVNKDGDEKTYTVTVSYSTEAPTPGDAVSESPNPLDEKPLVSYTGNKGTEEYLVDVGNTVSGLSIPATLDPRPVLTTSGTPFQPAAMREVTKTNMAVTWNTTTFSRALWDQYNDAVNSDSITVMGDTIFPETCKVSLNSAESLSRAGFEYWRVTVELKFRNFIEVPDPDSSGPGQTIIPASAWDDYLRNYSFFELVPVLAPISGIDRIPIIIEFRDPNTNQKVKARPQAAFPLDRDGRKITSADQNETAFVSRFIKYRRRPFQVLGIPSGN